MTEGPDPAETALELVDDLDRATALLHPLRTRLLAAIRTPRTSGDLAQEFGLTKQKVGYHLRELQKHGLVRVPEPDSGTGKHPEKLYRASADHYLLDPSVLGPLAPPADDDVRIGSVSLGLVESLADEVVGALEAHAASGSDGDLDGTPDATADAPEAPADRTADEPEPHGLPEGPLDPGRLLSIAARLQSELRAVVAETRDGRPSTLTLTVDAAFDRPGSRSAFAQAVVDAVQRAADEHGVSPLTSSDGGTLRRYRVLVACYPRPTGATDDGAERS